MESPQIFTFKELKNKRDMTEATALGSNSRHSHH
jgi:hypothetical protein